MCCSLMEVFTKAASWYVALPLININVISLHLPKKGEKREVEKKVCWKRTACVHSIPDSTDTDIKTVMRG